MSSALPSQNRYGAPSTSARRPGTPGRRAGWLSLARQLHLYLGVFSAPALLFFAVSGALQTFSLHETTKGSSYKPPAWIVIMGQIHKKQTAEQPRRKAQMEAPSHSSQPPAPIASAGPTAEGKSSGGGNTDHAVATRSSHPLPLRIFFLIVSLGFVSSVLTGVLMAYRYNRNAKLVSAALLAGAIVPVVLLLL